MPEISTEKPCQVCLEHDYKYTCPKCQTKTCSLACVRLHKQQSDCDGVIDNTEFVKRSEFHENENLVQRDYNFLMGLDRKIAVSMEETRAKNKKILMRNNRHNTINNNKRFQSAGQENVQSIVKRGVIVRNLPKGMQRAIHNRSGWDKKADTYMWTMEFVLIDGKTGKELERRTRLKVAEGTTLKDAIHNQIKDLLKGEYFCFMKKIDTHNEVIPLDKEKLVADLLRDQTVIEYPTILISETETMEKYKIHESEDESSSDSEDDSDSGSSSEEDSTTDGDSDSDEDDAPEEVSSRPPLIQEISETVERAEPVVEVPESAAAADKPEKAEEVNNHHPIA